MSNEIRAAIRAVVAATKAELASGTVKPELRDLTEKAIAAADKAVGAGSNNNQTRPWRRS